ncbi:hypothetical protein B0H13DRAFT_1862981 [Mycena leptocephala]|nr:hypothetical protein B0H13DRAFT_1862981 [Mycena leptocephala]
MTADGKKLELRMIGESRGNEVGTALSCWRSPVRVPMRPRPAHEDFTPAPPRVRGRRLHEQRLTQMGIVWMEVTDEDEDAAGLVFPGALPSTRNAPSAPIDTARFWATPHPGHPTGVARGASGWEEGGGQRWEMRSKRDSACHDDTRNVDGKLGDGREDHIAGIYMIMHPDTQEAPHEDDSAPPLARGGGSSGNVKQTGEVGGEGLENESRCRVRRMELPRYRRTPSRQRSSQVEGCRRCVGAAGMGDTLAEVLVDGYDEGAVYHVDGAVILCCGAREPNLSVACRGFEWRLQLEETAGKWARKEEEQNGSEDVRPEYPLTGVRNGLAAYDWLGTTRLVRAYSDMIGKPSRRLRYFATVAAAVWVRFEHLI